MPAFGENCSWTLERIEPYVDGELEGAELEAFERHIESCEACRRELAGARVLVSELRSLPQHRCPDRVVQEAAARVEAGAFGGRQTAAEGVTPAAALLDLLRERFGGRFTAALQPAAAVVLIAVIVVLFVVFQNEQIPLRGEEGLQTEIAALGVTEQELELAKLDVMLAFAYVNKYNRRVTEVVTQEGITGRVLRTLERSVVDQMYPFPLDE